MGSPLERSEASEDNLLGRQPPSSSSSSGGCKNCGEEVELDKVIAKSE